MMVQSLMTEVNDVGLLVVVGLSERRERCFTKYSHSRKTCGDVLSMGCVLIYVLLLN